MKRRKHFPVSRIICPVLALLTGVFVHLPRLHRGMYYGHDLWYHIMRLYSTAYDLSCGIFPSWINYAAADGAGCGVGFFYSSFFFYPFALPVALGWISAWNGFILMLTVLASLTALSMYAALRIMRRERIFALTGAFLYGASPYFLCDLLMRLAVGELISFAVFPWLAAGLYHLLFRNARKGAVILAFAFAALMNGHVIGTVIAAVVTALFLLAHTGLLIRHPRRIREGCLGLLLLLGLSCVFWGPVLEQMASVRLVFQQSGAFSGGKGIGGYGLDLPRIFRERTMVDEFNFLGAGAVLTSLIVLRFAVGKRRSLEDRFRDEILFAGILSLFFASEYFPWDSLPFLTVIQFPWRFVLPATMFLAAGESMLLETVCRTRLRRILIPLLVSSAMFLSAWWNMECMTRFSPVITLQGREEALLVSMDLSHDFFASGGSREQFRQGTVEVLSPADFASGAFSVVRKHYGITEIHCPPLEQEALLVLPIMPYAGYDAETEKGFPPAFTLIRDNRLLLRVLPHPEKQKILIRYRNTVIQILSCAVSLLTLLGVIHFGMKHKH